MSRTRRFVLGLLAGLGVCACQSSGSRRHAVAVGAAPVALVATPDGRRVVSVNHPATVSLIDARAQRELARIQARLRSSDDCLVDVALDSRGTTAWIVSSGGEILSWDLDTRVLRMRARTEEPLHLTAVAWARSRAFVGDIRGGLHALSGGALHEVLSFDAPIVDLETDGDMLYITTAEGGIGPTNSYLVAYDVASAGLVWDRSFEDHALGDMSIAGGRIWAAEFGDFRLLELTLGGERLATRYLSGGTLPRFALDQVAASDTRVVIASAEDSERRVLEYRKGVEGFATLPSAQYAVPGPCTALCLLGAWGLAAGVGDHVILIPGEEAQPLGTGR